MNFNKTKYVILFIVVLAILGIMSSNVDAEEYNWQKLKTTYKKFIDTPNCIQKQNLLKVLPHEKIEKTNDEVLDYFFSNLSKLEDLAKRGDSTAIDILFKMIYLTDGAYTERLSIVLGSIISNHPQEFLYAVKNNFQIVTASGLSSLVGNLGPKYVDKVEKRVIELEKRYGALKEVENVPDQIRDLCLYELGRQIFESRRDIIYLNGNQKMLENAN